MALFIQQNVCGKLLVDRFQLIFKVQNMKIKEQYICVILNCVYVNNINKELSSLGVHIPAHSR